MRSRRSSARRRPIRGPAEVKAEIASFQLRRSKRDEAEKAAREAIALDDENTEAHKVLGLIYAATADTFNGRAQAAQFAASAKEAITHLERAVADLSGASDINLHYTLGRLYMRMGDNAKAIAALTRVVDQNPGSVQGRLSLAQAYAAADDLQGAIDTLAIIVDEEPRVASTLAQYLEQAGLMKEAAATYTKAIALQPMSRELKFRRVAGALQRERLRAGGIVCGRSADAASRRPAVSPAACARAVRDRRDRARLCGARAGGKSGSERYRHAVCAGGHV